jgi:hypothetical protein
MSPHRPRTSAALRVAVLAAAVVALGLGASACDDSVVGRGAGPDGAVLGGDAPPQFVDEDFDQLYPIFLQHKIGQGPKAALWSQRYHRRWVRWTGRIRSFSANGITIRQLKATSTFDVSLWLNNSERRTVAEQYKVGDVVTYVGRLDSYDDVWRTLYLINGSVLQRQSPDAGAF